MTGKPKRLAPRPRPVLQPVDAATTLGSPGRSRVPHVALAAVVIGLLLGAAIEPTPTDPSAGAAVIETLLGTALVVSLAVAALCLSRPRVSLAGSAVVGVTLLVATIGCPVVGHHEVAAWWYGQLAIGAAATLGPLVARHRLAGA